MQTTTEDRQAAAAIRAATPVPPPPSETIATAAQIEQLATAMLQENLLQNVAITLQNAMVSSLQQAALLPPNSAAAAALNLQALESYLTLQRLTTNGRIDILKIATNSAKIGDEGGGGAEAATGEGEREFFIFSNGNKQNQKEF